MKIELKELKAAIEHIEKNSPDSSITIREDSRILKITVSSLNGSLIDYEIFDLDMAQFAKVRESKELCLK